jgi:Zn-dependent protease with chaperone function
MDFFEAQARARQRTSRLVALFALAVLGTILATYAVAVAFAVNLSEESSPSNHRASFGSPEANLARYWRPEILVPVALGTLTVVGLGSLYQWNRFRTGGSAVAESVGARRVDPRTTNLAERRLLNVVEEMAIASGLPVPATFVLEEEAGINAFAAGLTTHDAVVAVTRGTLEKLNRDELQGVIGHEFSHILNGDMRLNVRLSAIIFGILLIGLIGRTVLRGLSRVRVRSSSDRKGGGVVAGLFLVGLSLMIIGYVGYFFGRLLQAAVSRQREFLADASAVQFTRNPSGLTGALKKIGGYALGSAIQSDQAATIGHFFFAQGFRSFFGGLWATHPPLDERIRAIEPSFDGEMYEPETVVDVERESFASAGLAPRRSAAPPILEPAAATQAVAQVGSLTREQLANAQVLLDSVPGPLRDAAYHPDLAPVLVYGLLLSPHDVLRARQVEIVSSRAGSDVARQLAALDPSLRQLQPGQHLPLLNLALPVLRGIPRASLTLFLEILDELVHADAEVSPFEFALQKLLVRTLSLGEAPGAVRADFHSFPAVAPELSVVLSVLARAATSDPGDVNRAFAAGTAQLPLAGPRLQFLEPAAASLAHLDTALEKLARASGPIKQRTLTAAAHTVGADGRILVSEAELLRAIAAALDCPMPPLAAG